MTPAVAAAYVAIAVLLLCVVHLARERRRALEAIVIARGCLLVDDELEALRVLEAELIPPDRFTPVKRSSRLAGQL